MWTLTIRSSNKKLIQYQPKPGITTFGRSSENDITLQDDSISRHHAEIDFNPNKKTLFVRDLDSTNGCFVNGKRIFTPTQLEHGDQVRMGTSLITIKLASTQRLENKNIFSLTPELSQALLVESIENFGFLLNDLTHNLINISDQTEAIIIISSFTRDMVAGTACHIYLGDELDDLAKKGIPASIARTVIEESTPILISNIQADKSLTESLTSSKTTSLILVPVILDSLLSGIIYTYQEGIVEKPFDRNDLQMVVAISNQVTHTLQRFEHEKELIYHANHDPLTNLPNRTRLLDHLKHALARSKREKDFTFALFFFDVDDF
jgi:pSer/pThr/pTyr-binding forkhead associated (FHA) protein